MRNSKMVAVTFAGLALVLAGCTSDGDDEKSVESSTAASAAEVSAEQVGAVGGETAVFGEPFEFKDGLTVSVSGPEEFTPSAKAIKGGEENFVKFTLKLGNGTAKRLDAASVTATVTSGGGQGGDVIDQEQEISLAPGKTLRPGGQISWVQGFGVQDPEDVAVVVQAGMDRVPIAFAAENM
jgi:hypothetical protein